MSNKNRVFIFDTTMRDGKLCEVSNTEDLFLKPQHDYTKELLRLMPKIESIYN